MNEDALRQRYLTDAEFHAQVFMDASSTCRHETRPCSECLDLSMARVSAVPFLGLSGLPKETQ